MARQLYSRRDAARLAGCSVETLFNYERKGLLSPSRVSGRPAYTPKDVARAKQVFNERNQRRRKR